MTRRPRTPMSPRARSAFRRIASAGTGLATFGALVGTGWYAGSVARDYQDQEDARAEARAAAEQQRADWFAAHPVKRVIEKNRKHRTVVRTIRVAPGPGGTITSGGGSTGASAGSSTGRGPSGGSGGGSGGGSTGGGSSAAAPAPPPPPPPPPAPSSGS